MIFKIGDRVLCVKSHSNPICTLVKGREYIIYDIKSCKCSHSLNVGIHNDIFDEIECKSCNTTIGSNGIWWLDQKRFVKVQEETRTNYVKLEVKIEEPIYN